MRSVAVAAGAIAIAAGVYASYAEGDDRSTCFDNKTRSDAAVAACGRLIASGTLTGAEKAKALAYRGNAYIKNGAYDAAIRDLTEALSALPNDPAIYNGRGFAYQMKGKYDLAIADLEHAIRINPTEPIFHANLGNALSDKEQYARGIAEYNEAIRLNPNMGALYANRGKIFRESGDLDRALADFNTAIKLDPLPGAYGGRGLVWRLKNEVDRAIADYNKSIAINPNLPEGYTARGLAYEAKGDIASAKRDFRTALSKRTGVVLRTGDQTLVDISGDRFKRIAQARLAVLTQTNAAPPVAEPANKGAPASDSPAGEPSQRIALVIGNGAYPDLGALRNPPNDGRAMAKVLRDLRFEVIEGIDLDHAGFERVVREFLLKAAKARTALVFYAGHGLQIDGRNYLVPVDARLTTDNGLMDQMAALDTILNGLDDQIRTNIVILDACRDNPLAAREIAQATGSSRSIAVRSGLAANAELGKGATLGAGTLLAFATAPGQVAYDGDGADSPFSTALLRHLPTPGIEVQTMLTRVRAEVVAATRNKQVPWSNSSLLGEVYLAGKP